MDRGKCQLTFDDGAAKSSFAGIMKHIISTVSKKVRLRPEKNLFFCKKVRFSNKKSDYSGQLKGRCDNEIYISYSICNSYAFICNYYIYTSRS